MTARIITSCDACGQDVADAYEHAFHEDGGQMTTRIITSCDACGQDVADAYEHAFHAQGITGTLHWCKPACLPKVLAKFVALISDRIADGKRMCCNCEHNRDAHTSSSGQCGEPHCPCLGFVWDSKAAVKS